MSDPLGQGREMGSSLQQTLGVAGHSRWMALAFLRRFVDLRILRFERIANKIAHVFCRGLLSLEEFFPGLRDLHAQFLIKLLGIGHCANQIRVRIHFKLDHSPLVAECQAYIKRNIK